MIKEAESDIPFCASCMEQLSKSCGPADGDAAGVQLVQMLGPDYLLGWLQASYHIVCMAEVKARSEWKWEQKVRSENEFLRQLRPKAEE